jgi:hypothetical protein
LDVYADRGIFRQQYQAGQCNAASSRSTRSTLESDVAADDTVGNGHLRLNPHLLDYINPLKACYVPSTKWYGRRQPIPFPRFPYPTRSNMDYSNSTQSLSRNALSTFYQSSAYNVPAIQVILAILVLVICTSLYWKPSTGVDVPFVGYRSSWEPRFLAQIRYTFSAAPMISEGYKKVWRTTHWCLFPDTSSF